MQIRVPEGATLNQLARRYGTSVEELIERNPQISDPDLIFAGDYIEIPQDEPVDPEDTSSDNETEVDDTDQEDDLVSETQEQERLPRVDIEIGGKEFSIPEELYSSSSFKNADDFSKGLIAKSWQVLSDQGGDLEKLVNALETAAGQTDAYMGQQIRMFEDELAHSFGYIIEDHELTEGVTLRKMENTEEDLERMEEQLNRRRKQLEQDLEQYREDLSIDEQRELERARDDYDQRLEETRTNLAESGLTRSSIRARAEDMLEDAHQDMVEDIETKKQRELRRVKKETRRAMEDLEFDEESKRIEAARSQLSQMDQLRSQDIRTEQSVYQTLREGESYLGTDKMQNLMEERGLNIPSGLQVEPLEDIDATGLKRDIAMDLTQRARNFIQ